MALIVVGLSVAVLLAVIFFVRKSHSETLAKIQEMSADSETDLQPDSRFESMQATINSQSTEIAHLSASKAALETENSALHENIKTSEELLAAAKEEFSNLAAKAISEESKEFKKSALTEISEAISPMKQTIEQHRTRLENLHTEDAARHAELQTRIENTGRIQQEFLTAATDLKRTLYSSTREIGVWGEQQMASIMETAGLVKGRDYQEQVEISSADGSRQIVDVLINLPNGKHIVIDSKSTLETYAKYLQADTPSEEKKYLKSTIDSVYRHISSLSKKEYWRSPDIEAPSYVIMFMPVESVYMAVLREDPDISVKAGQQNIMLCSPTTLLPIMSAVKDMWTYQRQTENVRELLWAINEAERRVEEFEDKFESLGKAVRKLQTEYSSADAMLSGEDSVMSSMGKVKAISAPRIAAARTSALPPAKETA